LEKAKSYNPPPTDTVGLAFGVNDNVDVLPSGNLPIEVEKKIGNNGTANVAVPYRINEEVVRMIFVVAGNSAGFVPGNPPDYTAFDCNQQGPILAKGQKQAISFKLGSTPCPVNPIHANPTPPPALKCGLYRETMMADSAYNVDEPNENDNNSVNYFYVPSNTRRIIMNATTNPNNVSCFSVQGKILSIIAPTSVFGVQTHQVTASIVPSGSQGYTVNGKSPVGPGASGTTCSIAPGLPAQVPAGAGPLPLGYTCTIPDPHFVGPTCNSFLGSAPVYEEHLDTKLTAISGDGCIIAQKMLQVRVIFECQP